MSLNYSSLAGSGTEFTVIASEFGLKTATLPSVFPAGTYYIDTAKGDTDIQIFLGRENGSQVGASNPGALFIEATDSFKYVTTVNSNQDDVLTFKLVDAVELETKTDAVWAPPAVTGATPSSLPNVNSSTTVEGSNFASNATVQFRKNDNSTYVNAKSVTFVSSTALTVVRPDTFSVSDGPYDIYVTNPTTGLSALSLNTVTAGTEPSWQTSTSLTFQKGVAADISVLATDSEGSTMTYALDNSFNNVLPTGMSFTANEAKFTGTPSANGGSYSAKIIVTDAGGNTATRTFTLAQAVPDAPTVGTVTTTGVIASVPFTAPTFTGTSNITSYTATSSPGGITGTLSQSGSGTITVSGLTDGQAYTFTVRATNSSGQSLASSASNSVTPSAFSISTTNATTSDSGGFRYHIWKSSGSFTVSGTKTMDILTIGGGGGGFGKAGPGAGGQLFSSGVSISTGEHTVAVGGTATESSVKKSGTYVTRAFEGGVGSGNGSSDPAVQNPGTPGQGNAGGIGAWTPGIYSSGGGGGAGAVGGNRQGTTGGPGGAGSGTYASWAQLAQTGFSGFAAGGAGGGRGGQNSGGGFGAGFGGNDSQRGGPASANTGSGSGGDNMGGNTTGGSGLVMIRYSL